MLLAVSSRSHVGEGGLDRGDQLAAAALRLHVVLGAHEQAGQPGACA